ncbi:MAG: antA/AntB antirepressor family protein, partial [Wohlfahrtiimonas sp.]
MKQLIKISQSMIDDQQLQTVNARELHEFLEVKSRFNDWIKNRINEYGFTENHDYASLTKILVSGGQQIEYFISLNMAKELAMVERNEKGKQARQYFIACEEKLHASNKSSDIQLG